eukprot:6198748-Pleurochrysis_carterae.AAC.4
MLLKSCPVTQSTKSRDAGQARPRTRHRINAQRYVCADEDRYLSTKPGNAEPPSRNKPIREAYPNRLEEQDSVRLVHRLLERYRATLLVCTNEALPLLKRVHRLAREVVVGEAETRAKKRAPTRQHRAAHLLCTAPFISLSAPRLASALTASVAA